MTGATQILEADWTWTGREFESGVRVSIDGEGRITSLDRGPADPAPTLRLRNRALLPGMVSAHSHAFQRGLRGKGQSFPADTGSFWSWREAMYELVGDLDEASFRRWTRRTFDEMLAAGVTSVGEFHYFHHLGSNRDYRLDQVVLEEAAASGIRIVLIETFYKHGGAGKRLAPAQRRFATESVEEVCRQREALERGKDSELQSIALAAHSLRAATPEEAADLYAEARRLGCAFHIHLEEQPNEIEEIRNAFGKPPLALLLEHLDEAQHLTAIHCTQSTPADLELLESMGGRVCLCPTTEADLGDGVPQLGGILTGAQTPALGTDSNVRISLGEEMRWLEWAHRLESGARGLVKDPAGNTPRRLFELATVAGAEALGLDVGEIRTGAPADLVQLDLTHPALDGWTADSLLGAFIFGGADEAILATAVGGRWREHRAPRT